VDAAYRVEGASLYVEGEWNATYCVEGDTLRVLSRGDRVGTWVEVYTRR
jgi:hypothetical protein